MTTFCWPCLIPEEHRAFFYIGLAAGILLTLSAICIAYYIIPFGKGTE